MLTHLVFHYAIDTLLSRGRNKLDVERDLEITRNKCKYLQVQHDRAELDDEAVMDLLYSMGSTMHNFSKKKKNCK